MILEYICFQHISPQHQWTLPKTPPRNHPKILFALMHFGLLVYSRFAAILPLICTHDLSH